MDQMTTLEKAKAIQKSLVDWRRDFHMHPELGFCEVRTAGIVAETLKKMGLRVQQGVGKTGVVAEIGSGSPLIAIRADMDALPLQEENEVDYKSMHAGIMHACGHDAHTAMALGLADLLTREDFQGTVRFLFQPAEEVADDEGLSGAPRMVAAGAMQGVDMVLSQHVAPMTPTGQIRIEAGPASGGVDSWFARIIGKGGHGAYPHKTIDPFYICSHVIMALNAIVSRRVAPYAPAVVSIGSVHGGQAENVIPEFIDLSGTLRYTESDIQKELHAEITRAFELSKVLGGDYELKFLIGDPPMINHHRAVELITSVATDLIGVESILPMTKDLGGEDFGCFSQLAPGAMFSLGTMKGEDERIGHNPHFDIDENAMPIGTAILLDAVLKFLRRGSRDGI